MAAPPKKPDLDEPTLRIMERMLKTPPKPHKEITLHLIGAKRDLVWVVAIDLCAGEFSLPSSHKCE
jgi:hypothetical protein